MNGREHDEARGATSLLPPEIKQRVDTKGRALVLKLAKDLATNEGMRLRMVTEGTIAMMAIAGGYNRELSQFTTYIYPYVRGAMIDLRNKEQKESRLEAAIKQEARRAQATMSDQFEIFYDDDATTRHKLGACAQRIASTLVSGVVAHVKRAGTEDDLGEREQHRIVMDTIDATLPMLDEMKRRVWTLYHEESKTLAEVAKELGISVISARRYQEEVADVLFAAAHARGVGEMPRVD